MARRSSRRARQARSRLPEAARDRPARGGGPPGRRRGRARAPGEAHLSHARAHGLRASRLPAPAGREPLLPGGEPEPRDCVRRGVRLGGPGGGDRSTRSCCSGSSISGCGGRRRSDCRGRGAEGAGTGDGRRATVRKRETSGRLSTRDEHPEGFRRLAVARPPPPVADPRPRLYFEIFPFASSCPRISPPGKSPAPVFGGSDAVIRVHVAVRLPGFNRREEVGHRLPGERAREIGRRERPGDQEPSERTAAARQGPTPSRWGTATRRSRHSRPSAPCGCAPA